MNSLFCYAGLGVLFKLCLDIRVFSWMNKVFLCLVKYCIFV